MSKYSSICRIGIGGVLEYWWKGLAYFFDHGVMQLYSCLVI